MRSPSTKIRFSEAKKLLDYGFNKFSYKQFAKKGESLDFIDVKKGIKSTVKVEFESDAGCLIEKGNENKIEQNLNINKINAPVEKGQIVGKMSFILDGKEISSVNIIASEDVDAISIFSMSKFIIYKWVNLLR